MTFSILMILGHLIGWTSILTSVYGVYFILLALAGEMKKKVKINEELNQPATRFALVAAARNEEAVIGNLIKSLQKQNYPVELYDIYVAPNNCSDNTRKIAASHGAEIFDPVGEIRTKGDVLSQFVQKCMGEKKYDAICIFDADNIVHPDFLRNMNHAKLSGAEIAQGFKDSKNPTDSAVATSLSIYYWIIGRFYNSCREALSLSSFIMGTGFMVTTSFLEKIGGWNTRTITEDYEFSAQCVLAGERVHYVSEAIVYDEQPLTFEQSWKQRRRWSTGNFDSSRFYLKDLFRQAVRSRSAACLDLGIAYLSPVIFILSLFVFIGHTIFGGQITYIFAMAGQMQVLSSTLFIGIILCTLMAVFITYKNNRRTMRGVGSGISYFMVFLLSWIPINIVSLIKKQKTWETITHTRSITRNDILGEQR